MPLGRSLVFLGIPLLYAGCASSGGTLHYEWTPEKEVSAAESAGHDPSGDPPGGDPAQQQPRNEQPPRLPGDAGLEEMVAFALENNPDVEAAFERWRASVERAPQERALPDPELTYGHFVARTAERQGMMGRQRISITQMFPWFGTLDARGGAAEQRAHAVAHRLEGEANRVVAELRKQYAEYYYVETGRAVYAEHRELLEGLRQAVEARYESGFVGRSDVLRIGIDLDRVTERQRSLEEEREPVKAGLNRLLGRPAGGPLPEPTAWEYRPMDEAELEELAGQIYRNPELRARESEIRGAEEAVRLAQRRSRPDFMVGGELLERRGESSEGMVMLGISLPVWRESYAAARREARAEVREIDAGRRALALDLEARFSRAVFGLRDAERWLSRFDESLLPQAEEAFAVIEAAYSEGEASFLDLTRAQRELLDIRYARARSLADRALFLAELEELAGRGAPDSGHVFLNKMNSYE